MMVPPIENIETSPPRGGLFQDLLIGDHKFEPPMRCAPYFQRSDHRVPMGVYFADAVWLVPAVLCKSASVQPEVARVKTCTLQVEQNLHTGSGPEPVKNTRLPKGSDRPEPSPGPPGGRGSKNKIKVVKPFWAQLRYCWLRYAFWIGPCSAESCSCNAHTASRAESAHRLRA